MSQDRQNLINKMCIDNNVVRIEVNKEFKTKFLLDNFYAEYGGVVNFDISRCDYSVLIMPLLLNVAPIIWCSGETYYINELDKQLYKSLEQIHEVFNKMYPTIAWQGNIIPEKLVDTGAELAKDGQKCVGVLFSGGVDSICTSFRHRDSEQCLISVWGADISIDNEKGWNNVWKQCLDFGKEYGHKNVFVKSNFFSFINEKVLNNISPEIGNWWGYVQHGLGFAGLAAPLSYALGYRNIFIASTHTPDYKKPWGSSPNIEGKLKWANTSVCHDGFELSRQGKIRYIVDLCKKQKMPIPKLRVCYSYPLGEGGNCCSCEKCMRTITGLSLENQCISDWGFCVSAEDFFPRVRKAFAKENIFLGDDELFMWNDLKKRSSELLQLNKTADSNLFDEKLLSFAKWLGSFDFISYQKKIIKKIIFRKRIAMTLKRKFLPGYYVAKFFFNLFRRLANVVVRT